MTIAVACNLADGVVMGVDSAVTIHGTVREQTGVLKVYSDAKKLFQLYDLPICIASYGMAQLKLRTIESYVRQFEHDNSPEEVKQWTLQKVAEELWQFFSDKYCEALAPAVEEDLGKSFDEIPTSDRPPLGLMVGGFSPDEYLSEIWDVGVHSQSLQEGVKQTREPGEFGSSWRGEIEGVRRFHKGFSFGHLDKVISTILDHFEVEMDPDLEQEIHSIVQSAEYIIPWGGMPLQGGIEYVQFCLDVMINQTRFVIGAPTCGGNVRIGVVERENFEFVTDTSFSLRTYGRLR